MSSLQLLLLGAMAAWTPSLVLLALLLRRAPMVDKPARPNRRRGR